MIELKNIGSILKTKKEDFSSPERGGGDEIGTEGLVKPKGPQKVGVPGVAFLQTRIDALYAKKSGYGLNEDERAKLDREAVDAEITKLKEEIERITAHHLNKRFAA